ncbi:MAG: metal ABC transporter permease [Clostridiales Family XIII bacterium]|jgi:zinc transport system permease protein|nr:metal ABC transporter permease [Clostridiales Family XIII bacterium]
MFNLLAEMFSYNFLIRAVVVGFTVSLSAALLGTTLVLKRYSMIGDGLSHVGFGSLAIAMAMNAAPLAVSIPIVLIAAFLLLRLSENSQLKGDAAIALISTASLAIGIFVISVTSGINTDVCNYLFGSILAMSHADVNISVVLSVIILTLFVIFYNRIFMVTFDEKFAKASGISTEKYNALIAILTATIIAVGMRIMGALLISSLIVLPSLTSMRVFKTFRTVTICSAIISIICFSVGIIISYIYGTPSGASIVIINLICFIIFWVIKVMINKIHRERL